MSSPLDFARAFKGGSRARASTLLVVVHENGLGHARLGLSVGKVIWKSAVRRNRIRRIFREAFRLEYPSLPAGLDLILIPAEKRLDPDITVAREELVKLAKKAGKRLAERREKEAREAAVRAEVAESSAEQGDTK